MIRRTICKCMIGSLSVIWFASASVFASSDLPPAARVILVKVNTMLQKKDYPRAIETLMTFQAKSGLVPSPGQPDPKGYHHPDIYYSLGNGYLMQGKYEPAIAAYGQSVARNPRHTFAWLNLAKANYEISNYAEAGRCFSKGYATDSDKKPVHLYYSAVAYLMSGDHRRSIDMFEQLMAAHPGAMKLEWKENLVHALMAANQQQRALPHIRALAQGYTGDKQIRWQEILLYQYLKLNMRVEALIYAKKLTQQAPSISKWWKGLTHIQLNDGRYEDALAAMTIYSFLKPLTIEEKKLLADLSLQLGIPVKATPIYESCLAEKPDKKLIHRLALAYRQLGQPDTALERIAALQITSGDVGLMLLKGELHYLLKQYDKAAVVYRQVAQNKGKHAGHAWLMAGYAAWQMEDIPSSKKAFTKALTHKQQKKAATAALHQLAKIQDSQKRKGPGHDNGV